MKKLFLFLSFCMFCFMNIQAQVGVEAVKLDTNSIVLAIGGSDVILEATVLPDNASNKDVTWHILEGAIVIDTITSGNICTVSAVSVGTASVEVRTNSGNQRDTCDILVIQAIDDISIKRDDDTLSIRVDSDTILIAAINPLDASIDSILWTFSDPHQNIVSIEIEDDSICHLQTLSIGEVTLYTIAYDAINFDGKKKDSCVIKVISGPIESLIFEEDSIDVTIGMEATLTVHLLPSSGIDKRVEWYSLNTAVADVKSAGYDTFYVIETYMVGEAKIVAQSVADPDKTDTCVVTVKGIQAESLFLNVNTLVLELNADSSLIANLLPLNTTDKSIEWTSTDSSIVDIVSVNIHDMICLIKAGDMWGEATIYARAIDGDVYDSCIVQVIVPVDDVVMSIDSITLDIDSTYLLKAIVYPDTASYPSLTWTVSDFSIVDTLYTEFDSLCMIKALKAGEAIVYAISSDGIIKDSCVVTVNIMPTENITISHDILELHWDEIFTLNATVYPANASDQSILWTSSDSAIVDIMSTGNDKYCVIKAMYPGEATIFIHTRDGNHKDSCVVTVSAALYEVYMSNDSLTAYLDNDINTFVYFLEAAALPVQLVQPVIEWTSSDSSVVDLTSMSHDTICMLIPVRVGTAIIYATTPDGKKDSCFVTVKDQYVLLDTDTTSANNGVIEVALLLPENLISGSFTLHLPNDFGLARDGSIYRTFLSDDCKDHYDLTVTQLSDSIYLFDIQPVVATSSMPDLRSGSSLINLMDITYTIYKDYLFGSNDVFTAKFVDVVLELEGDTTLVDDRIDFMIKSFKHPTGNIVIINPTTLSYIYNHRLYVNSDKAETVSVYSLNGQLLLTGSKNAGQAEFNIHSPEQILIVKGSTGWAHKVINN